jgi:hypothetical protein
MGAGALAAIAVVAIWIYSQRTAWPSRAMAMLATPEIARRVLALQMAALLAAVPADLALTERWRQSIAAFQSVIGRQGGFIAFEDTTLARPPYADMVESWTLPSQSLVLRRAPADGVVLPPRGLSGFQPFDPRGMPPISGTFRWGNQGRIQ